MTRKPSAFSFDISVSADKKRRARKRGMSGAVETSSRKCEKEGCQMPGQYRAPKSADNLEEFIWFCMDHIREHNRKWNFFEGRATLTPEQAAAESNVWGRPTQPMGKDTPKTHIDAEAAAWQRLGFDDPAEVLGKNATMNPAAGARANIRRLPPTETKALEILDARDTMSKAEIRKVYKALVKDLHPDMNAGRRDDEERLAEVVWAWEQVKGSRSFRD